MTMRFVKDDTPVSKKPQLYRYVDVRMESAYAGYPNVDVRLHRYPIINETKCGWWIRSSYWNPDKKKWVSKTARGAWAKDTPEKALDSYIARKRRQIFLLEDSLKHAEEGLKIAQQMQKAAAETAV